MKKYIYKTLITVLLFASCKYNAEKRENSITDSTAFSKLSAVKNNASKNIHLKAKPDSISIDASSTAVIVVDMENDFGAKGGMFDRAGIDISMIQKVVTPTANVIAAARQAGIEIIYLRMAFRDNLSDIGSIESVNRVRHLDFMHVGDTINAPDGSESRILIRDSWGTEIIPELKPQPGDIVIYKTRFSGFYKTNLDSTLKQLNKKYLIITGCTTSICVESTVRDAMFRDYLPIVLEDCTAEPIGNNFPRSNHQASLLTIQTLFGWVSNSIDFIQAVQLTPTVREQKRNK
ncbi:MAG: cysteine hydrolase [Cytophagales bacterium]|nr:cysteine hydrolase [Cytophagales bacterium]